MLHRLSFSKTQPPLEFEEAQKRVVDKKTLEVGKAGFTLDVIEQLHKADVIQVECVLSSPKQKLVRLPGNGKPVFVSPTEASYRTIEAMCSVLLNSGGSEIRVSSTDKSLEQRLLALTGGGGAGVPGSSAQVTLSASKSAARGAVMDYKLSSPSPTIEPEHAQALIDAMPGKLKRFLGPVVQKYVKDVKAYAGGNTSRGGAERKMHITVICTAHDETGFDVEVIVAGAVSAKTALHSESDALACLDVEFTLDEPQSLECLKDPRTKFVIVFSESWWEIKQTVTEIQRVLSTVQPDPQEVVNTSKEWWFFQSKTPPQPSKQVEKHIMKLQLVGAPASGKTSVTWAVDNSVNGSFRRPFTLATTARFAPPDEDMGATRAGTQVQPISLDVDGLRLEIQDTIGGFPVPKSYEYEHAVVIRVESIKTLRRELKDGLTYVPHLKLENTRAIFVTKFDEDLPAFKDLELSGANLEMVGTEYWSKVYTICRELKETYFSTSDIMIIPVELPAYTLTNPHCDIRGPNRESFARVHDTVVDALKNVLQAELNRLKLKRG